MEKNHPTWTQSPVHLDNRSPHIVDEVQRLRQNKAVKGAFRQEPGFRKIADDRRLCCVGRNVQHVLVGDSVSTKALAIC